MNFIQACLLICLGAIFASVDGQIATRQESDRDMRCGANRYYNELRHTCLPW